MSIQYKMNSLLCAVFLVNHVMAMEQNGTSLYQRISQEHLAALPIEEPEAQNNATLQTEFQRLNHELGKQLNPSVRTSFTKVCRMLTAQPLASTVLPLDADVCNDLNILVGSHKTQSTCLANLIPTRTHVGRSVKCAQLLQPTGDLGVLEHKRLSVKGIIDRFARINSLLVNVAHNETAFLSFCSPGVIDDPFYQHIVAAKIKIPFSQNTRALAWLQEQCNKSEFAHAFKELAPLVGIAAEAYNLAPGVRAGLQHDYGRAAAHMQDAIFIDRYAAEGMAFELIRSLTPHHYKAFMDMVGYAVWAKQEASWATEVLKNLRENAYRIAAMQSKLSRLASFINSSNELSEELRLTQIPGLIEISNELRFGKTEPLRQLEKQLQSSLFTGKDPLIPSWGAVKSLYQQSYEIMNAHKKELVCMYHALGQLDVLNASAQLHVQHPTRYTVPTFAQLDHPWLCVQEYWNPFLDPKTAITNSMELDGVIANHPRTAIITGPNGKGKTTTTTLGLSLAMVLAHSLSIAPASNMIVTPCAHIMPMIKVETNIGKERSLLMSVAERIGALLKLLSKPGFKFFALDEPCSGATKDHLAHAAALVLIKKIAQNRTSLCVVTTHFQEPTFLEKEQPRMCANYRIIPGFKIEKGTGSFSKDENSGLQIFTQFAGQEFAQEIIETMEQQEQSERKQL